ncbi:hypothetical protein Pmar_PMAR019471, partial [Perkinsus marinus ATCC 50983]
YQERGVLLDAHMVDLTTPLIAFITEEVSTEKAWPGSCHLICSTLYLIFKIRGLNSASSGCFPHDIALMEPVLKQAEEIFSTARAETEEGWESKWVWESSGKYVHGQPRMVVHNAGMAICVIARTLPVLIMANS